MSSEQIRPDLGKSDQLVFVHIPKTAGTTLRTILEAHFRPEETYQPYHTAELERVRPGELDAYRFVRGHLFYDVLRRLLTGTPTCITFLRDPIERTLSAYGHVKNHFDPREHVWTDGMDLEEYVYSLPAQCDTNIQTRMLGAVLDCTDGVAWPEALRREMDEAVLGMHVRAADAMRVLDEIAFFGVAERFDDSLALLAHMLGLRVPQTSIRRNVALRRQARDLAPRHVLDRLVELNQEDIELYSYAARTFETRFSQMTRSAFTFVSA